MLSVIVGRAPQGEGLFKVSFRPVSDPNQYLAKMLSLYSIGRRIPLALFPTTSLAFAVRRREGEDQQTALRAAGNIWLGELQSDEHYLRAFGSLARLESQGVSDRHGAALSYGPDFVDLAETYLSPLLEHLEVEQGVLKQLKAPVGTPR